VSSRFREQIAPGTDSDGVFVCLPPLILSSWCECISDLRSIVVCAQLQRWPKAKGATLLSLPATFATGFGFIWSYEVVGVRYNNLTDSARALSSKLAASARSIFRDSVLVDTKSGKCIVEEFDISQQSLSSHNGGYVCARSSTLYAPDDTGERYVPVTKVREELVIIDL
jgi:hypothetical protein